MFSALWMLGASGCFTLMALIIKIQSARLGIGDLLFLRLISSALWVLLFKLVIGFHLRTQATGLHLRRAACGCAAMAAWYHTLGTLPMGVSVTLNYMSPLFLGALLYFTQSGQDAPSKRQIGTLVLGFAGVAFMMNPFGTEFEVKHLSAYGIGLMGALLGAMAFKDVRVLKAAGETEWQMVFYFSLLGAALSLPFTQLRQLPATTTPSDIVMLVLAGLLGAIGQLGVSKAFSKGDPMVPAAIQYTSVVFSVSMGWMFFRELLSACRLVGMLLVVVAAVYATASSIGRSHK